MSTMSGQHLWKGNQGFSMLEALVAVVVIAVGLLGVAVLYVEGLKAERTSVYRTTAVVLASEMADRIRVNPTGLADYAGAAANNGCRNGAGDCTAAEMAADDLFWWQQDLAQRLPPGANGTVTVAPGAISDQYTITVTWSEAGYTTPRSYAVTILI